MIMAEMILEATRARLRDLLAEEQRLLTQFLLVTREQERIIAAEDEEALSRNLEQRQDLIGLVDCLLSELMPLWQAHSASLNREPAFNDLHADIGRILREITELDKKNQLAMGQRLDFLSGQIRLASETRRGAETYIKGAETFAAGWVDERQ
jgi:hypothetical protein